MIGLARTGADGYRPSVRPSPARAWSPRAGDPPGRTRGARRPGDASLVAVFVLLAGMLLAACGAAGSAAPSSSGSPGPASSAAEPPAITVSSAAFAAGGRLPTRYTCDGDGDTPPLAWSGVPASAASLAVVVDDPDAPDGTYTHWIVGNLPPGAASIDGSHLPVGAVQARNSAGRDSYTPPCPPSGVHHYRFTVTALSVRDAFAAGASTSAARAAIEAAATASGTVVATYSRP